jgi:hypothetical protein
MLTKASAITSEVRTDPRVVAGERRIDRGTGAHAHHRGVGMPRYAGPGPGPARAQSSVRVLRMNSTGVETRYVDDSSR